MKVLPMLAIVQEVIDRSYRLSEAADAMRHLATGRAAGKTVIAL